MVGRKPSTLMAVIILAAVGISILLIISHILNYHPLGKPAPIPTIAPRVTYYGFLQCYGHLIVIPSNSIIVLNYRVRGNVTINGVVIYMAFPAGIINETLTAFSRLPNPSDALVMGVYVNGRLIASTNNLGPIQGLEFAVNNSNGYIAVGYTSDEVDFPTINLTSSDTLVVVIYSAVPYALPSCAITNESEEVELMVGNGLIGISPTSNATQAAEQLYVEGRYITEEPIIYIINVTKPINQLPQELTPNLLTKAKPLATGYAPSYAIGQALLPTVGNSS